MERMFHNRPWLQRKAEYINNNFIDCRRLRTSRPPPTRHDIFVEKDSYFSVRDGIGRKKLGPTKYWGIVYKVDLLSLISRYKIELMCPNCMDEVYTNLWLIDADPNWRHLAIISPDCDYGQDIARFFDCGG